MERLSQIEATIGTQERISERSPRPGLRPLYDLGFPNYFEYQSTRPNAYRDEEQWSDSEVGDTETN